MEHEFDLLTNHVIQWHLPLVAFLLLLLRRGPLAEETDCFPSLKNDFPYLTSACVCPSSQSTG